MQPTDRFEKLDVWGESKFAPKARPAMLAIKSRFEAYGRFKKSGNTELPELPVERSFHELCFDGWPTGVSLGHAQKLVGQFAVDDFFLLLIEHQDTSFYEDGEPTDDGTFFLWALENPLV